jgi:hypothetical protein
MRGSMAPAGAWPRRTMVGGRAGLSHRGSRAVRWSKAPDNEGWWERGLSHSAKGHKVVDGVWRLAWTSCGGTWAQSGQPGWWWVEFTPALAWASCGGAWAQMIQRVGGVSLLPVRGEVAGPGFGLTYEYVRVCSGEARPGKVCHRALVQYMSQAHYGG